MNLVVLLGRPTADPEVRYTPDGKMVATFTLAVDRIKEGADFIRCQAWEKRAEFIQKYITKGKKILVDGRIRTGSYTDKDGKKIYTTDVIINGVEFAEKKDDSKKEEPKEEPKEAPKADSNGFMYIPDSEMEELPFN